LFGNRGLNYGQTIREGVAISSAWISNAMHIIRKALSKPKPTILY
jgi:hypothetical protein